MRVVSLLPSATEIVCALGARELLVGRSHECDFPAGVESLPAVSLARIDSEALESAAIDDAVREALARGEQLYGIDEAALARLRPDLVVTQTLCTVCAVAGDGVRSSLRARSLTSEVLELEPTSIDGMLETIAVVAEHLGLRERADGLVGGLRERLAAVARSVEGRRRVATVAVEWLEPPFAAGHWVPEMIALAGGRELLGRAGRPSFTTTWDAVRAAAPEVCLLAPCGFDVERTLSEAAPERVGAWLRGTPALAAGQVYALDATSYLSRPGPRLVDGVELCASLLHPESGARPLPAAATAVAV